MAATVAMNSLRQLFLTHLLRGRFDGTEDPLAPDRPTGLDTALAQHIAVVRPALVGIEIGAFQ